ncbi:MAG: carbohydrate binding family 9 domain-containing protein [Candidatus Omnitrophota bacterium]
MRKYRAFAWVLTVSVVFFFAVNWVHAKTEEERVDLEGYYSGDIFSSDAKPAEASLFPALPAEELPASGKTWTFRGVTFKMPEVSGVKNNVVLADGIIIKVTPRIYTHMYLLGIPLGTPVKGDITVKYVDGSTEKIPFGVTNWWMAGSEGQFGEKRAVGFTHSNNWGKSDAGGAPHPLWFHDLPIRNPNNLAVEALIFPDTRKPGTYHAYHLMAITLTYETKKEAAVGDLTAPQSKSDIKAPVIDGRLDDAAWQSALQLTGFKVTNKDVPASMQTTVFFFHDGQCLYFGFRCDDLQVRNLAVNVREGRDGPLWNDDCAEVLLDPYGDQGYFHFIVNALGVQYDGYRAPGEKNEDSGWNGLWTSAAVRGEKEWTAEIAVPFATLGLTPGRIQEKWGFNFAREFQFHTDYTQLPSADDLPAELSSWMPTYGGFCDPERFGKIRIAGVDFSRYNFAIKPLSTGAGLLGANSFRALVTNSTDVPCPATFNLNARYPSGESAERKSSLVLKPGRPETVNIPYPIGEKGTTVLRVSLNDSEGKMIAAHLYEEKVPALLDVFLLSPPQTFDDTVKIRAVVNTTQPLDKVALQMTLLDSKNKILLENTIAPAPLSAGEQECVFPFAVEIGTYTVKVQVRESGKILDETAVSLAKVAAPAGSLTVIDENGYLRVNGKKFFPFGFYNVDIVELYADHGDLGNLENRLNMVRDAGVNTLRLHWVHFNKPAFAEAALDFAQKFGFKVIINEPNNTMDGETHYGKSNDSDLNPSLPAYKYPVLSGLEEGVKKYREHPALLAWYVADELVANAGFHPGQEKFKPENVKKIVETVFSADPYHPMLWVENVNSEWPLKPYTDAFRHIPICALDRYWPAWFPKGTGRAAPISIIADNIEAYRKWFRNEKTIWMILQYHYSANLDETNPNLQCPTTPEMRCQAYLAVVHGASGILYWYRCSLEDIAKKYPECWAMMSRIGHELAELTPVICSKPVTAGFLVKQSPGSEYLHAAMREYAGKTYLFVVNAGETPVQASFVLQNVSSDRPVKTLFEKNQCAVSGNTITDTLEGNGVRIYEIQGLTVRAK